MDTQHINAYLKLIEALLQCAKGEEWLLLQQHEDLIDAELLTVMTQVAEQLNTEGNAPAAQFLQYWMVQLSHLLQQNTAQTPAESRSQSYLQLIQTLLGCAKGDEVAILSQHPELMDEGLVYTMNQVAAQLAAKGDRDIAIYLKHLAADVNRVRLHPSEAQTPRSSPPPNSQIDTSIDPDVTTASELHPDEGRFVAANPTPRSSPPLHSHIDTLIDPGVATVNNRHPVGSDAPTENRKRTEVAAPIPSSAPPSNSQIEELLANISSRLAQMEISIGKHSTPHNPLWYMPILEQADTQGWIISSEEVEQLIGIKPHCDSGHNFLMRGCWKFVKVGKIGTHSSWRVIKEIVTLPSVGVGVASAVPTAGLTPTAEASPMENRTPEPEPKETNLEPDLVSPWTESN
jgi:hypothetical protein